MGMGKKSHFYFSFFICIILIILSSISFSYYSIDKVNKKFLEELKSDSITDIENKLFGSTQSRLIMMMRRQIRNESFFTISSVVDKNQFLEIRKFLNQGKNSDKLQGRIKSKINDLYLEWDFKNDYYLSKQNFEDEFKLGLFERLGSCIFQNKEFVKYNKLFDLLDKLFSDKQKFMSYWIHSTNQKFEIYKLIYKDSGKSYTKKCISKLDNDKYLKSALSYYIGKMIPES